MLSKVDMGQREALYSRNLSAGSHKSLGSAKSATGLQQKQERELCKQHIPLISRVRGPYGKLWTKDP